MDAKVEKAVDLDRHFGRLPFGGFCDNAFPVWIPNLMLGVKCDNRESVHGSKKVALTPNIGLEATQTRSGGSAVETGLAPSGSEDEL